MKKRRIFKGTIMTILLLLSSIFMVSCIKDDPGVRVMGREEIANIDLRGATLTTKSDTKFRETNDSKGNGQVSPQIENNINVSMERGIPNYNLFLHFSWNGEFIQYEKYSYTVDLNREVQKKLNYNILDFYSPDDIEVFVTYVSVKVEHNDSEYNYFLGEPVPEDSEFSLYPVVLTQKVLFDEESGEFKINVYKEEILNVSGMTAEELIDSVITVNSVEVIALRSDNLVQYWETDEVAEKLGLTSKFIVTDKWTDYKHRDKLEKFVEEQTLSGALIDKKEAERILGVVLSPWETESDANARYFINILDYRLLYMENETGELGKDEVKFVRSFFTNKLDSSRKLKASNISSPRSFTGNNLVDAHSFRNKNIINWGPNIVDGTIYFRAPIYDNMFDIHKNNMLSMMNGRPVDESHMFDSSVMVAVMSPARMVSSTSVEVKPGLENLTITANTVVARDGFNFDVISTIKHDQYEEGVDRPWVTGGFDPVFQRVITMIEPRSYKRELAKRLEDSKKVRLLYLFIMNYGEPIVKMDFTNMHELGSTSTTFMGEEIIFDEEFLYDWNYQGNFPLITREQLRADGNDINNIYLSYSYNTRLHLPVFSGIRAFPDSIQKNNTKMDTTRSINLMLNIDKFYRDYRYVVIDEEKDPTFPDGTVLDISELSKIWSPLFGYTNDPSSSVGVNVLLAGNDNQDYFNMRSLYVVNGASKMKNISELSQPMSDNISVFRKFGKEVVYYNKDINLDLIRALGGDPIVTIDEERREVVRFRLDYPLEISGQALKMLGLIPFSIE